MATNAARPYRYICDDCGIDCTMGAPAGPATMDLRGVTRCLLCYQKHGVKMARLHDAAEDLLAIAKEWRRYFEDATAGRPPWGPILERTKTAIAKAEGRP